MFSDQLGVFNVTVYSQHSTESRVFSPGNPFAFNRECWDTVSYYCTISKYLHVLGKLKSNLEELTVFEVSHALTESI